MSYTVLATSIIVCALLVVFIAGKLLFKRQWFLGWLRGMVGILLTITAACLLLAAIDFYSYKQLTKEQFVANLSFTQTETQQYQVALVDSAGTEFTHELYGDLWQLDARVLKWSNSLSKLGLTAGYRLDRLSGRYYSLEDEKNAARTVYQLEQSKSIVDIWQLTKEYGRNAGILDASYGSATYMPMEDGALFSVTLSNTGLIARPLNDRAKSAVQNWE